MLPCDHEEADTRVFIHLLDALDRGSTRCLVRTVDTDVVVILIGKFHALLSKYPTANIWVAFGTGKSYTHYHINAICQTLGKQKSIALPSSIVIQVATQHRHFVERGKDPPGRRGMRTMKSPVPSALCLFIRWHH